MHAPTLSVCLKQIAANHRKLPKSRLKQVKQTPIFSYNFYFFIFFINLKLYVELYI